MTDIKDWGTDAARGVLTEAVRSRISGNDLLGLSASRLEQERLPRPADAHDSRCSTWRWHWRSSGTRFLAAAFAAAFVATLGATLAVYGHTLLTLPWWTALRSAPRISGHASVPDRDPRVARGGRRRRAVDRQNEGASFSGARTSFRSSPSPRSFPRSGRTSRRRARRQLAFFTDAPLRAMHRAGRDDRGLWREGEGQRAALAGRDRASRSTSRRVASSPSRSTGHHSIRSTVTRSCGISPSSAGLTRPWTACSRSPAPTRLRGSSAVAGSGFPSRAQMRSYGPTQVSGGAILASACWPPTSDRARPGEAHQPLGDRSGAIRRYDRRSAGATAPTTSRSRRGLVPPRLPGNRHAELRRGNRAHLRAAAARVRAKGLCPHLARSPRQGYLRRCSQ